MESISHKQASVDVLSVMRSQYSRHTEKCVISVQMMEVNVPNAWKYWRRLKMMEKSKQYITISRLDAAQVKEMETLMGGLRERSKRTVERKLKQGRFFE